MSEILDHSTYTTVAVEVSSELTAQFHFPPSPPYDITYKLQRGHMIYGVGEYTSHNNIVFYLPSPPAIDSCVVVLRCIMYV